MFRHLLPLTVISLLAACSPQEAVVELESGPPPRLTGVLRLGEQPKVEYEIVDGEYVIEGDMALPPSDLRPIETAGDGEELAQVQDELLSANARLWPDAVVPYTISSGLSATMQERVRAAIEQWNTRTVARFVPRNGQADYVTFRPSPATYAYASVGRVGGQQFVNLVANPTGVIVHEMGHTLGFLHEHTRPDRDSYVTIHWSNIRPGFEGNFSTYSSGRQAGPYDIDSIMHYPSYEFSRNGYATITRKNGTTYPQNYTSLSAGDAAGIAQIYGKTQTPGIIYVDSNASRNDAAVAKITVPSGWVSSTNTAGYWGTGYWYANTSATATDELVFSFYLPTGQVRVIDAWWTAGTNRAPDAPFTIISSSGANRGTVRLDQRTKGSQWNVIGTFNLPAGWNTVRLGRNAGGSAVIGDAVRIRPAP